MPLLVSTSKMQFYHLPWHPSTQSPSALANLSRDVCIVQVLSTSSSIILQAANHRVDQILAYLLLPLCWGIKQFICTLHPVLHNKFRNVQIRKLGNPSVTSVTGCWRRGVTTIVITGISLSRLSAACPNAMDLPVLGDNGDCLKSLVHLASLRHGNFPHLAHAAPRSMPSDSP